MSTSTLPAQGAGKTAVKTSEAGATRWWSIPPKEPFLTRGPLRWWLIALALALGVGLYGLGMRLIYGLAATDLSSQVPWGAWVAFYVYFVGLSAGSSIISSLVYAFRIPGLEPLGKPSLAVSIISLGVGLAFIGMDLGSLIRSPLAMLFFHWTSPLSWAVRAYIVYLALMIVQLVLAVRVQRGHFRNTEAIAWWMRLLSAISLPMAIGGVLGAEGSLFAVVKVRGMWAGGLFPVIFLASAIVAATALMATLHYAQRRGAGKAPDGYVMRFLGRTLLAALMVDAGLTAYEYVIPLLSQNHHELHIIKIVMTGPYAWTFWGLQIALGLLIPIFLLLRASVRASARWVSWIGLAVLVGLVGVRFNIVLPPQIAPVMEGYPVADYTPTFAEWSLSLFLVAAGLTAYTLLALWQPIHDSAADSINYDDDGAALGAAETKVEGE